VAAVERGRGDPNLSTTRVAAVLRLELRHADLPPLDGRPATAAADEIAELRQDNADLREQLTRIENMLSSLLATRSSKPRSSRSAPA
jgi:hypothetical protein